MAPRDRRRWLPPPQRATHTRAPLLLRRWHQAYLRPTRCARGEASNRPHTPLARPLTQQLKPDRSWCSMTAGMAAAPFTSLTLSSNASPWQSSTFRSVPLAHFVCIREDLSSSAPACSCSMARPALTCQTSGFYGFVSSMISSKTVAKPSKHVSSLQ